MQIKNEQAEEDDAAKRRLQLLSGGVGEGMGTFRGGVRNYFLGDLLDVCVRRARTGRGRGGEGGGG